MKIKYSSEKELDEFFRTLNGKDVDFKTPRMIPTEKDGLESVAVLSKRFKAEAEAQWQKYPFSFLECSDDLRKDENVICTVAQYFPREVKNALPNFLSDPSNTSHVLSFWLEKALPSHQVATRKKVYDWAVFFFQPTEKDEWFYSYMCCEVMTFKDLPKSLRTKDFIKSAIITRPSLSKRIANKTHSAGDFNMPWDIAHDKDILRARVEATSQDRKELWLSVEGHPKIARMISDRFDLEEHPISEKMKASKTPFKVLLEYIELEVKVEPSQLDRPLM